MLILHQQITRVGVRLLSYFNYDDEKNIFPPPVFDVRTVVADAGSKYDETVS